MDPDLFIPTEGELAIWKNRAISVFESEGQPDVAEALRSGGLECAMRALFSVDPSVRQRCLRLLLAPLGDADVAADGLTRLLDVTRASTATLPPTVDGAATATFSDELDTLRDGLHSAAMAEGRRRQFRFAEHLLSVATAVRLNTVGTGAAAFTGSGDLFKSLTMTLTFVPTVGVVSTPDVDRGKLAEAFALALAGFAPCERLADGWIARRIVS
jgi:hypothetical protein